MKTETNSYPVCKSPLNNSTSKAAFSFGRASRSPNSMKNSDAIYDLPSMLSNRSTYIGFGKKTDLGPKVFNPSPDKYEKKSDFQKSPNKGCSFGISRQNFKAISMFYNVKNPGPGAYNTAKEDSKSFMIRGRDGFPQIFQSTLSPGPGKYQIKQSPEKQCYAESKKKSPYIYSFKKGKQNNQKPTNTGPGSYETGLASMGRQILAHNKTQKSFHFPKQIRETLQISKSKIGPGSYQSFSEFGK